MAEYFDVLDEDGKKTGAVKLRDAVHRDGDWHAAVNIFVVNPQNEVLLQRRSANKDSYPNMGLILWWSRGGGRRLSYFGSTRAGRGVRTEGEA